jgi:UPF0716 protein FxsA
MVKRFFLLYVLVEMAVIVALTATIGFGWTLIVLIGTFVLGLLLAGSQARRQLAKLQQGMRNPQGDVTDSALVALGSVLVFVPGLVTTAAGLLMLAPPTRAAMRPLAGLVAAKGLSRRVTVVNLGGGVPPRGRGQYIDGEVVDVHDDVPVDRPLESKPE